MINTLQALVIAVLMGMNISGYAGISSTDQVAPTSNPQSSCELVVLAKPDDPYYPLAEEIATAENAPISHTLTDALACQPVYLLWVVSPTLLSDAVMVDFGLVMKEQSSAISSGIITASSMDKARELWQRRTQAKGNNLIAANAASSAAHIYEGQIIEFVDGKTTTHKMTKSSLISAFQTADYLTFTGHGANRYLKIEEDILITAEDVPTLDSLVIGTGSCQTVRPWNEDSISLKFVDQGAAAYTGFLFSPNSGYLMGEFDGLPFRYTWPDFPIGHAVQVQNHGTLQGFAAFPFQFLVGDPRIALQNEPPYHLENDRQEGAWRSMTYGEVPAGVIPMRIEGGAIYNFVEAPGVTAASLGDALYNNKLQMVNIRNDKFVLLEHPGGKLTLRMRLNAPWYWLAEDILLDSLDATLIYSQQSDGDAMSMIFAIIPLLWTAKQIFKKRLSWQKIRLGMMVGVVFALLQGLYVLLRLDQVTIISKDVVFSPLSLVAAFVLSTCGTLIYIQARKWISRVTALLVITFAGWSQLIIGLLAVGIFNIFASKPNLGTAMYNYSLGLMSLAAFVCTFALSALVLWVLIIQPRKKTQLEEKAA